MFDGLPKAVVFEKMRVFIQRRFGASHHILPASLWYPRQERFAEHSSVPHPDPAAFSVGGFHQVHDLLHGLGIMCVARKDLIGERQPFRRHHQSQTDLLAIRPGDPGCGRVGHQHSSALDLQNTSR